MSYPQIKFHHTAFAEDSFIARKRKIVFENTIPYQLHVLKETGTYDAYKLKWRESYKPDPQHWPVPADFHLFWDSDIGKWIEGACYSLRERKNEEIEKAIGELVEMIRNAQQSDGYLNIHFTVVEPEERFRNLRDMHELYNAGHLIEAAIAHHELFQNDRLLEPISKYVDLLYSVFGPAKDQKHGYPGHPETELALLRLYAITKNQKHLALGRYFIDERGNPNGVNEKQHYYDWEAEQRGERPYERPTYFPVRRSYWYQQAHAPITEQESVEGHSVRAMYLLTGAADLQRQGKQSGGWGKNYMEALKRLWSNMVEKKMYLTGGIGAMDQWEGFGIDYFLPQSTDEEGCYAETCAAIGVMMFAQRMLQLELDGQYADIMELCFYNAVLGGMSCDGRKFAYTNQLASCEKELCERKEWFTCACCPPNVSRLLGSLGGYMWDFETDEEINIATIRVHMFGSAALSFKLGNGEARLTQKSDWPWDGNIDFSFQAPINTSTTMHIRIPSWAKNWKITPQPPSVNLSKDYLYLQPKWLKENPNFRLIIPTISRFVSPHPFTNQNTVTLARGPLVYCVEDTDNPWVQDHFRTLLLNPSRASISEGERVDKGTGERYIALTVSGACSFLHTREANGGPGVLSECIEIQESEEVKDLHFVPFYYRANRGGKGQMRVGLRKG